jgi:hypothetical protein
MVEDLILSARDLAMYTKLYASAGDIGTARECARYIKKNGWHDYSFMRRGSVRVQQTAFYTTLIVAYARPFAIGRSGINFPQRLLQYGKPEAALHDRLIDLRHKEYAHSDPSRSRVQPLKGIIKDIFSIRDVRFSVKQIDTFLGMTDGLQKRITQRIEEIRQSAEQ